MSEYMIRPVPESVLNALRGNLEKYGPYEGYPNERLILAAGAIAIDGILQLPEGPWEAHRQHTGVDPNVVMDPEVPLEVPYLDPARTATWRSQGGVVDQHGRPVHPNWPQFKVPPGLPTGIGRFRFFGENATVDGAIYRPPHQWLLIQRASPDGAWALPGGFVEMADPTYVDALRREISEETGLTLTNNCIIRGFPKLLPITNFTTFNAWSSTNLCLVDFGADMQYLYDTVPVPGDDAVNVGWFTREQMEALNIDRFYTRCIDKAIAALEEERTK